MNVFNIVTVCNEFKGGAGKEIAPVGGKALIVSDGFEIYPVNVELRRGSDL